MIQEIMVIEPPKRRFSWTIILEEMMAGAEFETDAIYGRTISSRISREIKAKYPDRVYETDSKSKPGRFIVRRLE